jgi:hypothetical protein
MQIIFASVSYRRVVADLRIITLREELEDLRPLMGTESGEFYSRVKHIAGIYTSEEDKKMIADFMDECLNGIDDEITEMEERTIKLQL